MADEGRPTLTIIIILGPIGSGKTTTMHWLTKKLTELGFNVVAIDGDDVGDGVFDTTRLGGERGDYTIYRVIDTLRQGKLPILSTGGGVLSSRRFRLPEIVLDIFSCDLKIITILTGGEHPVIQSINPKECDLSVYDNGALVERAILNRITRGDWELPKGKTTVKFVNEMVNCSRKNKRFARCIMNKSHHVFQVPLVTPENRDRILKNIVVKPLCDVMSHNVPREIIKIQQVRYLVEIEGEPKYRHITVSYSRERKETNISEVKEALCPAVGQELPGTLIEVRGEDEYVFKLIHVHRLDRYVTERIPHVTMYNGKFYASSSNTVLEARRDGRSEVILRGNKGLSGVFQLDSHPDTAKTVRILDMFYL